MLQKEGYTTSSSELMSLQMREKKKKSFPAAESSFTTEAGHEAAMTPEKTTQEAIFKSPKVDGNRGRILNTVLYLVLLLSGTVSMSRSTAVLV